jgi:hypothetical protein
MAKSGQAGHQAHPHPVDLGDDRLVGALAISEFRGEPLARTRYLIRRGLIPIYREGRIVIASKAALREAHLRQASQGAAR